MAQKRVSVSADLPGKARSKLRLTTDRAKRARDVLTVLRVRGLAMPDATRERILARRDTERLERWLEKAIVAALVAPSW